MGISLRLICLAVICFAASGVAPSEPSRGQGESGREQASAELQSALSAAAAHAEPIAESFLTVDRSRVDRGKALPAWTQHGSSGVSTRLTVGARNRAPTDQRRTIRLTCHGTRASHSNDEPPEPPRLSS